MKHDDWNAEGPILRLYNVGHQNDTRSTGLEELGLLAGRNPLKHRTEEHSATDGNLVPEGPIFENLEGNLLSAEQLADRLQIRVKTIRSWRYKRVLPQHCMMKVGQRLVKYRWDRVLEWLIETNGGQT